MDGRDGAETKANNFHITVELCSLTQSRVLWKTFVQPVLFSIERCKKLFFMKDNRVKVKLENKMSDCTKKTRMSIDLLKTFSVLLNEQTW